MKSEICEGYLYRGYVFKGIKHKVCYVNRVWHRIDGPAWIAYKTPKKKEVEYQSYYLYSKRFHPWWVK